MRVGVSLHTQHLCRSDVMCSAATRMSVLVALTLDERRSCAAGKGVQILKDKQDNGTKHSASLFLYFLATGHAGCGCDA